MTAVETPSQRIWRRRGELDADPGLSAYLDDMPTDPETLTRVAHRVETGTPLRAAVADFLDDLNLARDTDDVARRIRDEPPSVDSRTDAYLGALAEHIAARAGLPTPSWSRHPDRFLDHFWWPTSVSGLAARAVVESPAAFRRRGIFVGASTLERV